MPKFTLPSYLLIMTGNRIACTGNARKFIYQTNLGLGLGVRVRVRV